MKRPLVVITAGFVLGEVLALCLQEAVYRKCFWFAGALFLAALIARHFLGKDQDRYLGRDQNRDLAGNSGRSVTYRILLLIFMLFLVECQQEVFRSTVQKPDGPGGRPDRTGRIWGCGAADRTGNGCTGKKAKNWK